MAATKRLKPKFPSEVTVNRALDNLLEGFYPPPQSLCQHGLDKAFIRRHDDTDGERGPDQELCIGFTRDMDAWVMLPGFQSLRFRTPAGGGNSPRVQKALLILAEAIRRDSLEVPQSNT